ncbi:MAG: zinc-binding dehydrogenase [Spirochaetia bacterium]
MGDGRKDLLRTLESVPKMEAGAVNDFAGSACTGLPLGRGGDPALCSPTMVQVQIARIGGPEVLRAVEVPSPPLLPDHVRIKVSAAGVNFADVHMRMGLYAEAPRIPFVPGFEVAGVVAEVGPGVRTLRRGERVLAACHFGGYSSEVVLPAAHVRRTPRKLSDKEAASIPIAFMTAWIALMEMARVREGDRVLVPGAAGGVGTAIVQLAARAGAQVVAVVGSAEKKEAARTLGASQAFTYAELDARDRPDARDFTTILDARGGPYLKDSMRRLAPGGRVVSYGVSSLVSGRKRSIPHALRRLLQTPLFTPIGLAMANKGVFGLNMLKLFDTEQGMGLLMKAMDGMLVGFQAGLFKAVVAKSFTLANAGDAHAFLQARKNFGKVVLTC